MAFHNIPPHRTTQLFNETKQKQKTFKQPLALEATKSSTRRKMQ